MVSRTGIDAAMGEAVLKRRRRIWRRGYRAGYRDGVRAARLEGRLSIMASDWRSLNYADVITSAGGIPADVINEEPAGE